jgi:alpha-amylase
MFSGVVLIIVLAKSHLQILQEWGDDWEDMVDDEKGNYDYLMFNDVEFRNPAVKEEFNHWENGITIQLALMA